jgi:superfamily II DNA or RNA helicase
MLKFRPYQEIAYNDCLNYLNDKTNYKKSIVIAGTGWGKALLIGALAKAIESPVLVLQPSKELLEQNFSKLIGFGGEGTIFSAGLGIKEISKTTFATPKSIIGHIDKFIELGVNTLLVDECFTGDTEILTEKGFQKFNSLNKNLKVAQWENGNVSFVNPLRYIEKDYNGEMINFNVKHNISVPMTPNHEQLIINKNKQSKVFIKDIKFKYENKIPTFGTFIINDENKLSDLERLYIATQADGSIHKIVNTHVTISFSFAKDRKVQNLLNLCKSTNTPVSEVKCRKGFRRFLVKMPIGTTKIVSNHINFPMSVNKAKEIIEEMVLWDGYINNKKHLYYYSSVVKENVDFYQSVSVLCGYSTNYTCVPDNRKTSYKDLYRLYINKNPNYLSTQNASIDKFNYNGKVYCVEVPSNNIVIRHNGFVFITGNCHLQCKPGSVIDNIIKKLGNKIKVIGFTATPIILVNNREGSQLKMLNKTKSSIFNNIIHVTQIQELIKNKYWSKLIYEQCKQDQSYLKLNSQGTEFTEYSVNNFFSKNNIISQMKEANNKLANERNSILIFVPSIADGESLKKLIDRKDCDLIHSYLDNKERELIINKFKLGVLKTLININIAGVGFDHPALDTIIHGAPTNSFARYSQHIGRGVRIHPNKKDCLILDFSSNYERFGKVENITYECIEHYGWGMFNGEYCLTSQPINFKPVTKDYLISYYGKLKRDNEKLTEKLNEYTLKKKDIVFTFGKHKGETIKEIAQKNKGYLKWLLEQKDFKWENLRDGLTIKNEIIQNL